MNKYAMNLTTMVEWASPEGYALTHIGRKNLNVSLLRKLSWWFIHPKQKEAILDDFLMISTKH